MNNSTPKMLADVIAECFELPLKQQKNIFLKALTYMEKYSVSTRDKAIAYAMNYLPVYSKENNAEFWMSQ